MMHVSFFPSARATVFFLFVLISVIATCPLLFAQGTTPGVPGPTGPGWGAAAQPSGPPPNLGSPGSPGGFPPGGAATGLPGPTQPEQPSSPPPPARRGGAATGLPAMPSQPPAPAQPTPAQPTPSPAPAQPAPTPLPLPGAHPAGATPPPSPSPGTSPVIPAPERVVEPVLRDQPEMYRSTFTREHPFFGLLTDKPDPNGPIRGKSLALHELLSTDRTPTRRRALLHAYWDLSGAFANYQLHVAKESQIRSWHQLYTREAASNRDVYFQKQLPLLNAAVKSATQQRLIAAGDVAKKQYALLLLRNPNGLVSESSSGVSPAVVRGRLRDTVTQVRNRGRAPGNETPEKMDRPERPESSELPIPVDYPFTEAYITRIDEMPGASQEARRLDRILAIQYDQLQAHRENVAAATESLGAVSKMESDSTMLNTLAAWDRTIDARKDMVDAVVEYNKQIADYTSETIPGGIALHSLLEALIKLPKSKGAAAP